MTDRCKYCGRESDRPDLMCHGTRCMEESGRRECYDALMRLGGGEYNVNQGEAIRRQSVWERWGTRQ